MLPQIDPFSMDGLPPAGAAVMYVYFAVLAILCVYGSHRFLMVYLYYRHAKSAPRIEKRFEELPVVTVQLPVFNELYVVERLIDTAAAFDYPRDRLHIQVLDDSTDESREVTRRRVEHWKEQGLDIDYIHREDRSGYKAGALDHGLKTAKGDLIAIFDADFVPNPDFLRKTVHYFTDEKVGCVQARWGHLNREYSLLTRLQSVFLDGHFIMEHAARNRSGRFFNFSGTAGMWRRAAIDEAGGWQHDTLTEDLDLSFRAQLKGWKFVFVPEVEAPAELPVEIHGFKSQQHRWVKGSIQTSRKLLGSVLTARIPLKVKTEGILHLTGNTAYILTLFLSLLLFPVTYIRATFGFRNNILLDLAVFAMATLSIGLFYITSQRELGGLRGAFKTIFYAPLLLCMGIGMCISNAKAVLEGFFTRGGEFVRTPKYDIRKREGGFARKKYRVAMRWLLPWFELVMGLGFGWVIYTSIRSGFYGSIPFQALFLFGFLYVALLSLFQGRLSTR